MSTPKPDSDNQKLIDQYTEIAQLAGSLAHEIKNPLSTIRLNVELLAEDLAEGDTPQDRRALRKVETVKRECLRLEELLNDFLNFAKAHKLSPESTDINKLLKEIIDFYAPRAKEAKVDIIEYFANDLPMVMIDRRAFQQAIWNLILNSQQAMPHGGQLVVRTRAAANAVAIDLIDNGDGMDDATKEKLFDAFYSSKRGGSGLGLPTTRKIVEGHGGLIAMQSEIGHGTQFTILLPTLTRLS